MAEAAAADGRFPDDPAPVKIQVPTADRLARAWAREVADTSFVPMDRPALLAFLLNLATDLRAAYTAETFDRTVALRVGATVRSKVSAV